MHTESYYSGYYALESIDFPDHYIGVHDDGNLWLEPDAYTTAYMDDASFTIYKYDTSRKYIASPAPFSVVNNDPVGPWLTRLAADVVWPVYIAWPDSSKQFCRVWSGSVKLGIRPSDCRMILQICTVVLYAFTKRTQIGSNDNILR